MPRVIFVKYILISISFLCCMKAYATSNDVGYYLSPKLIIAHSRLSDGQVSGSYQEPLILYTDQDHDKNDNNTSDIVGGALLSLGYNSVNWRAEVSYSYRYRFDLNGDVGGIDLENYQRHDNIPGHFRLDINTQALRFDFYYKILAWQTETLKPFVGLSVESLQHNILAKVRNAYNYSEQKSNTNAVTFGIGIGSEIAWKQDMNFIISLHYLDLGDIKIGPQSDNAHFSSANFKTLDFIFGVNYYF